MKKDILAIVKDLSVIIVCWCVIIFLFFTIRNTFAPASKVIKRADKIDVEKINRSLENIERVTKNLEAATAPGNIKNRLELTAENLVRFADGLASSSLRLEQSIAAYEKAGDNLASATNPKQLDARLIEPFHKNLEELQTLIAQLRMTSERFSMFQDQIGASWVSALSRLNENADDISSGVQTLMNNYARIGDNLRAFSEPQNLKSVFSLTEAARQISMPLSKSAAEVERTRLVVRIKKLIDDDMKAEGYNVKLDNKNIVMDDYNILVRIRIDSISLIGQRGRQLQERWNETMTQFPKASYKQQDMMRWAFSIAALKRLAANGISLSEDLEQILTRLPQVDNIADIMTPDMVDVFQSDAVMKKMKTFFAIKKVYPNIRIVDTPLALPFRVSLTPLSIIREELPF